MKYSGLQANIFGDAKIQALQKQYSHLGIHLFFRVVTLIADKVTPKNVTCKLEYSADQLADLLKCPKEQVLEILQFMGSIHLLYRVEDFQEGEYYCPRLLEYADKALRNAFPGEQLNQIMESLINTLLLNHSPKHSELCHNGIVPQWHCGRKEEKRREEKRKEVGVSPAQYPSEPAIGGTSTDDKSKDFTALQMAEIMAAQKVFKNKQNT